jgi:hypothetical protein
MNLAVKFVVLLRWGPRCHHGCMSNGHTSSTLTEVKEYGTLDVSNDPDPAVHATEYRRKASTLTDVIFHFEDHESAIPVRALFDMFDAVLDHQHDESTQFTTAGGYLHTRQL